MSNIDFQTALNVCTASIRSRAKNRATSYVLYYSNNPARPDGKLVGTTVKQLISEFRTSGSRYQYALIYKLGSNEPIRVYNRDLGGKFFSMTRTGVKRKKQG